MSKKYFGTFLFIMLPFCFQSLLAQSLLEKRPLTEILKTLETRFECDFSYANEDIENIVLVPPPPELDFKSTIQYLGNNTELKFNILEGNLVTIAIADILYVQFCGTVRDHETNIPIPNVAIQSSASSTISDLKGNFTIEKVRAGDSISLQHLSYKPNKIIVAGPEQPCKTIYLLPKVQLLDEIVVFNYLTQGINKTSEGSLKINSGRFGILPGLIEPDALQMVQALPGIQSLDESVTNINIRGGTHDQNLILWNGIKMYQSGHFFSLISAFNPHLANSTTLTKNGSAAHLTDGVSGTIAMESSEEISTDFKAALGVNMINVDGFIDVPLSKKASVLVSGRRSYSDVISTDTYDHYFEKAFQNTEVVQNEDDVISANDSFRFYDINAVLNYQISKKDYAQISFIYTQNNLSFLESAFINNIEESLESRTAQRNLAGGFLFKRTWNERVESTLQVFGLGYTLNAANVDVLNGKELFQENKVEESGFKLQSTITVDQNTKVNAGYDFIETGIFNLTETDNPLFRRFSKDVVRRNAVFSELDYRFLNQRSRIKAGLRINHIDPFDQFLLEPRLSYKQLLGDLFIWDVLGEMKHQASTQTIDFQNDFLGIENRRWIASNNKDVPIIKSKQLSTGFTYKNKGWLCNLEVFYKDIDGIVSQSQEFRNQYEFSKAKGSYNGKGIDFLVNKKIGQLSSWLGYSFLDMEYQFGSLQSAPFPSNFNIDHSLNLGAALNLKNFKIATGINWRSGKPTTRPIIGNEVIDNAINYEPANASRLSDYFRWDVSMTHDLKVKETINVHTGISLWNITNKANEINNYYEFTDITFPSEVVQNSLKFTPNILFRVTF